MSETCLWGTPSMKLQQSHMTGQSTGYGTFPVHYKPASTSSPLRRNDGLQNATKSTRAIKPSENLPARDWGWYTLKKCTGQPPQESEAHTSTRAHTHIHTYTHTHIHTHTHTHRKVCKRVYHTSSHSLIIFSIAFSREYSLLAASLMASNFSRYGSRFISTLLFSVVSCISNNTKRFTRTSYCSILKETKTWYLISDIWYLISVYRYMFSRQQFMFSRQQFMFSRQQFMFLVHVSCCA